MPYKICPECRRVTYSSADCQLWFCPCCGADLSQAASLEDGRCILQLSRLRRSCLQRGERESGLPRAK